METILVPFSFRIEDTLVTVWEVTKSTLVSGDTWYHVLVSLRIGNKTSRRFPLDVKNWRDLKRKLLVEISKFKLYIMLGGEKWITG